MTKTLFLFFLLFFSSIAITAEPDQENVLKLHVIYSENIQKIMQRLSLSVYDNELTMEQIEDLFDIASELYLAATNLKQALPGIDLSVSEKNIFENIAKQLQVEANNLGYMAQQNDYKGMKIVYERLNNTCAACHELFRF